MANRTYHPRFQLVHGFRPQEHPLYVTWADMLVRCYNPSCKSYPNYGGRGITVDPRWHHFANFAEDMGLKPDPAFSLERKDNNSGYSKANCTWATSTEQAWNRRLFRNNTTGARGVVKAHSGRYHARFDWEKQRYAIGYFDTLEQAAAARDAFIGLFFHDRQAALAMLEEETIWCTSSTKVRGVTPHVDGGFIARTTVNKKREYVGYFPTVEAAAQAIAQFKKTGATA